MLEKTIERHLVNGVKKLGGLCYKFTSPSTQGVPDRIIITAQGRVIFAELKTTRVCSLKFSSTRLIKCYYVMLMCECYMV